MTAITTTASTTNHLPLEARRAGGQSSHPPDFPDDHSTFENELFEPTLSPEEEKQLAEKEKRLEELKEQKVEELRKKKQKVAFSRSLFF